jgi:hypothetical protein
MGDNQKSRPERMLDAVLRRWCEHNRDRYYVPEWLLKKRGMSVDPNVA